MSEGSGAPLQVKREIPKSFKGIELDIDPREEDVMESLILAQDKRWRRT
jgi:hypothetical protein